MKITLLLNDQKYDIEITEELKNYENFMKELQMKRNSSFPCKVFFSDDEEDRILLKDKFDYEYMLALAESDVPVLKVEEEKKTYENKCLKDVGNFKKKSCERKDEEIEETHQEIANLNLEDIKKMELLKKEIKIENNDKTLILDDPVEVFESNFSDKFDNQVLNNLISKKKPKKKRNCKEKKYTTAQIVSETLEQSEVVLNLEKKIEALKKTVENLSSSVQKLKTNEKEKQAKKLQPFVNTIHNNFYCDNCGKENFQGKRFICLECDDFDLCENCESKEVHIHNMVRTFTEISHKESNDYKILYDSKFSKKPIYKKNLIMALTANKFSEEFYSKFEESFKACSSDKFVQYLSKNLKSRD
jgi:hypothetical protein